MTRKERYDKYKSLGLCVECGKEAEKGRVRCRECLDKVNLRCKKRRQRLKSKGICVVCGQNEAFCGHTMCPECIYKDTLKHIRQSSSQTPLQKMKRNEYRSRQVAEHKQNGICICCTKPANHGIYCYEHMLKRRRYRRKNTGEMKESKFEYRKRMDLCHYCGAELPKDNSHGRACANCAERFGNYVNADTPANRERLKRWKRLNSLIFRRKDTVLKGNICINATNVTGNLTS